MSEIRVDFYCHDCGGELEVEKEEWDEYHKWINVLLAPCKKCLAEAAREAREEE